MLLFVNTGCSSNKGVNNENNSEQNKEGEMDQGFRRPDFGQPDREPDVRGLVKSITANEVVIIKLDRPNRDNINNEDKDVEQQKDETQKTKTMNMGSGGPGMGMRGGAGKENMSEENRAQMLEKMKEMSSGEEKVVIPVGIQMLKPNTSETDKKNIMLEASLTDIKQDTMVNIWLDESVSDKKVASFVLLMK